MDNDLHQLEAELKRLQPAAPPHELLRRVERDLSGQAVAAIPPSNVRAIRWLWVAALPVAAAIAILVAQFSPPTLTTDPSANQVAVKNPSSARGLQVKSVAGESPFKPIAAENVLISARDEGLITLEDGTTARRERRHYVDTITWKNPQTNASLRWSVPREEVRVVPVAFQ
jgi:hypothetical protein